MHLIKEKMYLAPDLPDLPEKTEKSG